MYVYFPVKKIGTSSKFTSYWKGPFVIQEKISDVLFKVDCGKFRSLQVIHIDRIRKAREQVLTGEVLLETGTCEDVDKFHSDENIDNFYQEPSVEETKVSLSSRGREIKKPSWHKDYLFSTLRSKMAERKTRVGVTVCPVCKEEVSKSMRFDEHIVKCAGQRELCSICKISFKKKEYLNRHLKIKHGVEAKSKPEEQKRVENEQLKNTDSDSEWQNQSDVELIDEESLEKKDHEIGRLYRKRTNPELMANPVKVQKLQTNDTLNTDKKVPSSDKYLQKPKKNKVVKEPKPKNIQESESDSCSEDEESLNKFEEPAHNSEKHMFNFQFGVEKGNGEKLRRSIDVTCDDEKLISSTTLFPGKFDMGKMEFVLSDFVGPETKINPDEFNIVIENGKFSFKFNY